MKVYLAASWSLKHELAKARDELAGMGIEVTSRWLDAPDAESMKTADIKHSLDKAAIHAGTDLQDIDRADVVLVITDAPSTTGGLHVEFGYAAGRGKRVLVCGPRLNVFHALTEHWPDWRTAARSLTESAGHESAS